MEATDKASVVDQTISQLQSGAHEVVDKVASQATQAVVGLSQKGEELKNAEQQFVENCRCYVNENPITTLGIAVGAGFLLSRLLSSR